MFIRKFEVGSTVCERGSKSIGVVKKVDEKDLEFAFLVEFDDGTKKWCAGSNLLMYYRGYKAVVYINKKNKSIGAKVNTKYGDHYLPEAKNIKLLYSYLVHFAENFREDFFSQKFDEDVTHGREEKA